MQRKRKRTQPQEPPRLVEKSLFPEMARSTEKRMAVLAQRGPIVSALIKSIRLGLERDAQYWTTALLRAGVDPRYLGYRCFGSACEDNLSLQAIEMGSELARRPPRHAEEPYYCSVLASCRGLKWFDPAHSAYLLSLADVWQAPRDLRKVPEEEILAAAAVALQSRNLLALAKCHRELAERRHGGFLLVDLLLAAAVGREAPVQRLAAVCTRHKWLVVAREMNPVLQLMWTLCRGPFPGCEEPIPLDGLDALRREAEARWAAPTLEPVPAWCLDGVHTEGTDGRFAGDWPGVRNMIAMFACYGRLDPADPGILIPGPPPGDREDEAAREAACVPE